MIWSGVCIKQIPGSLSVSLHHGHPALPRYLLRRRLQSVHGQCPVCHKTRSDTLFPFRLIAKCSRYRYSFTASFINSGIRFISFMGRGKTIYQINSCIADNPQTGGALAIIICINSGASFYSQCNIWPVRTQPLQMVWEERRMLGAHSGTNIAFHRSINKPAPLPFSFKNFMLVKPEKTPYLVYKATVYLLQ